MGLHHGGVREFNDIETLKSETPDELPRIVSIEVQYNLYGDYQMIWGYKINYANAETAEHRA